MLNLYSRAPAHRLLLDTKPRGTYPRHVDRIANFDSDMMIILAAMLCALICILGINSIIKCIFRCYGRMSLEADEEAPPHTGIEGLKKAPLRHIPVAVYGSKDGVSFTDCPICLCEFLDGENIRVIPKCHHCFHVNCVDVWLGFNSSCPTCRGSLVEEIGEESGGEVVVEVVGRHVGNGSGGHRDSGFVEVAGQQHFELEND